MLSRKLRLLLLRDLILFFSILGLVLLPDPYGAFVVIAASIVAIPRLAKAIRETNGELSKAEKYVYLGFTAVCIGIFLILLFHWAARHNNITAWGIAGVVAFVLLVVFFGTVVTMNGGYRKVSASAVKTAIAWFVGSIVAVASYWNFCSFLPEAAEHWRP